MPCTFRKGDVAEQVLEAVSYAAFTEQMREAHTFEYLGSYVMRQAPRPEW